MRTIIAALLFLLLFGCLGEGESQPALIENVTSEEPEKVPSFMITSPLDGEVFDIIGETTDITVTLSTKDLLLKPPNGVVKSGEGCFNFILDGKNPIIVYTKSYTLTDVGIGEHTLTIELLKNDRSSYSPKIVKTVHFRVTQMVLTHEPKVFEVSINDFSYDPAEITIKVGDTVKWTNIGKFPRSVTSEEVFGDIMIAAGQSYSYTFTQAGTYEYTSTNYPAMKGKIIVEE